MATELQQAGSAGGALTELDEFSAILKQNFKPRSDVAAREVENAVGTLVREALADESVITDDILDTIDKMLAKIDEKLSAQVNEIIHNPDYQKLESAWRGLAYTVNNTESDATLKLQVFNVSKAELDRELRSFPGAKWDQSPLFKKIYEAEFDQLGGQPFGALVGDFYFDHSSSDVRLLRDLGKIAAASIGQVHVAKLATGEDVVVKLQRPGARTQIERDLDLEEASLANREYRVLKHNIDAYRTRFDVKSNKPYAHMDLTGPVLGFDGLIDLRACTEVVAGDDEPLHERDCHGADWRGRF